MPCTNCGDNTNVNYAPVNTNVENFVNIETDVETNINVNIGGDSLGHFNRERVCLMTLKMTTNFDKKCVIIITYDS